MDKVLFEKRGPVAHVTINRPERLNACDYETYGLLNDAWLRVNEDPEIRVAVLTGAGERAFCTGRSCSRSGGQSRTSRSTVRSA